MHSRVELERTFVLHQRPYRESSLLLEVFAAHAGRIGLLAKGARRPQSRWRGILQPFRPLLLSWSGRGELASLTRAELVGRVRTPNGRSLLSAFYVNELLLRLLHRHDAHPELFETYHDTLTLMCDGESDDVVLRIFEKKLLAAIGYGLVLDRDIASGDPLEPDCSYDYWPDRGPVRQCGRETHAVAITGRTLRALATEQLDSAVTLREAKLLMRRLLGIQLGERPLHSRGLFRPRGREN